MRSVWVKLTNIVDYGRLNVFMRIGEVCIFLEDICLRLAYKTATIKRFHSIEIDDRAEADYEEKFKTYKQDNMYAFGDGTTMC